MSFYHKIILTDLPIDGTRGPNSLLVFSFFPPLTVKFIKMNFSPKYQSFAWYVPLPVELLGRNKRAIKYLLVCSN